MKKTGKLKLFYLLLTSFLAYSLLAVPQQALAQNTDIQVEARLSETNIYNGESVLLEFVISGRSLN
ncbi:MAG: hypothetical protein VW868_06370, partial [Bacteroidota bacterium]